MNAFYPVPKQRPAFLALALLIGSCGEKAGPTAPAHQTALAPKPMHAVGGLPPALLPTKNTYLIDPHRDTALAVGAKGNLLHIPKGAFVDAAGSVVVAPVTISFREFRNAAEMAFSGITMVYAGGDQPQWFNSAGMFEIGGTANGTAVRVAKGKGLKLDYRLAQKVPETAFFRLNEDGKGWQKLSELPVPSPNAAVAEALDFEAGPIPRDLEVEFTDHWPMRSPVELYWLQDRSLADMMAARWPIPEKLVRSLTADPGTYLSYRCIVDTAAGRILRAIPDAANPVKDFDAAICAEIEKLPPFRYRPAGRKVPLGFYPNDYALQIHLYDVGGIPVPNDKAATLLAAGADAGHTYPDIVAGLNVESFGVYNCDQIYRVANLISVQASYTDEAGQTITDGRVLSLVDRRYNGAFSFSPSSFQCNSKSDNVLLLFTASGKLFATAPGQLQQMHLTRSGSYAIRLEDISASVKTTESLAAYLKLKI